MEAVSEKQFKKAKEIAREVREVMALEERPVQRKAADDAFATPSAFWDEADLFSYCLDPSYELVNTWRMHTLHFTSNHMYYTAVYADRTPPPPRLRFRYRYLTDGLPAWAIARPPGICAEFGWNINGGIVNPDSIGFQRHLTALYRGGVLDYLKTKKHLRILEIGSGYGGFAYFMKAIFPDARYYCLDLPRSLVFAGVYLSITQDADVAIPSVYDGTNKAMLDPQGSGITFVPHFLAFDLAGATSFDLVINTGSFGEMTDLQVDRYADLINETLVEGGLLYEENMVGGDALNPTVQILKRRFKHGVVLEKNERIWFNDDSTGEAIRQNVRAIHRPAWIFWANGVMFLKASAEKALRKIRALV